MTAIFMSLSHPTFYVDWRFNNKWSPYIISSEVGESFLKELIDKGFDENPKTKAFMDDLKFLLGKGNIYMGTFSEMMEENKKQEPT